MGRPWILPLRGIHYRSQGHSRLREAPLAPKLAGAWDTQACNSDVQTLMPRQTAKLVSEPHSFS